MADPTVNRKRVDPDTGETLYPEDWTAFLDWWFSEPRVPKTIAEWATLHDYHPDSVTRWKRDPDFRRLWDERANEVNLGPDRVQDVIEALYRKAKGGDVKAAALYLQYIERYTPKKAIVVESAQTAELSDEELERMLREELGA